MIPIVNKRMALLPIMAACLDFSPVVIHSFCRSHNALSLLCLSAIRACIPDLLTSHRLCHWQLWWHNMSVLQAGTFETCTLQPPITDTLGDVCVGSPSICDCSFEDVSLTSFTWSSNLNQTPEHSSFQFLILFWQNMNWIKAETVYPGCVCVQAVKC